MKIGFVSAAIILAALFPFNLFPQTGYRVLHSFGGQTNGDGAYPWSTLAADGSLLYGSTTAGGNYDGGTIFAIDPDGSGYSVLHHFGAQTGDPVFPAGSLVSDGSVLYGTAAYSGANDYGTVFSLNNDGSGYADLHSFSQYSGDGARPLGGVVGSGEMLYGTTAEGGNRGWGTVFVLEPNVSSAAVLHSFGDTFTEGIFPLAAPALDSGVLYGTTFGGGVVPPAQGIVFSLLTDGSNYQVLHTFGSQTGDGTLPFGGILVEGGRLYGTTEHGGANYQGTVYSLNPDGSDYTVIHDFSGFTDGVTPMGTLVSDGTRLYGMAAFGGAAGPYGGAIFALAKDGSGYTVLHDFSLQTGLGYQPFLDGLLLLDNTLYGMTALGGDYDCGVVFSYTLPSPTPTPVPTPWRLVMDGKDYNGDGRDDLAVWRPADGRWVIDFGAPFTPEVLYFGGAGDLPASGDYDGDGTTDPAIFRPATGLWAADGATRFYFGRSGDLPVPADYSGDGYSDPAVFRPATGLWAVRGVTRWYFGRTADLPIPGDFSGTGMATAGIFRPASGLWAVRGTTRGYFGSAGDYPSAGDYGGSGVLSPAIFRPGTGLWAVRGVTRVYYGATGDYPQPGDFAGFGTSSPAIYRPARGLWAVRGVTRSYWGGGDYVPVSW